MDITITLSELSDILKITPHGTGKIIWGLDSKLKGNTRHLMPEAIRTMLG